MRATVLLDARLDWHRGEGATSSFEWAVSAVASVAVSLAGQRYGVRLLLDDRPAAWTAPFQDPGGGQLLDSLAVVEAGGPQLLPGALAALARTGGDGLVVAVLGEVDEGVATALARLGRQGTRGVALLLRTTGWATLPDRRAADLDAERAQAMGILLAGGWSVAEAGIDETVATVWARATGTATPGPLRPVALVEPGGTR
jgi:uncharacterized protein (DUF58 family)